MSWKSCCAWPHGKKTSSLAMLLAIIAYCLAQAAALCCSFIVAGASLTSAGPVIAPGISAGWGLYSFQDNTPLAATQQDGGGFQCWIYSAEQIAEYADVPFTAARTFAMMANIFIGISMILLIAASCLQYTQSALYGIAGMLIAGGLFESLTFVFYASKTLCGTYGCTFSSFSGVAIAATFLAFVAAFLVTKLPIHHIVAFPENGNEEVVSAMTSRRL